MKLTAPGLFDLQLNGYAGVDFNDPAVTSEAVSRALDTLQATGVTRCLPTIITSSLEDFAACARAVVGHHHPANAGIHMEGPYISPEDGPRGAHPRACTREASVDDFERRQEAADGRIRLVTLAPEVPGTPPLIEHLVDAGIRVAIGHSGADETTITDAVSAGATMSTHLGNGCSDILPRHPNVIWTQLAEDRLVAGLIVDGIHLPPEMVKSMVRAKTLERTILVTDAVTCAGCPPGRYRLGPLEVELSPEGRVWSPTSGTLAGSALLLPDAVANLCRFTGTSIEEALPLASTRPAAYLEETPRGRLDLEWDPSSFTLTVEGVELP
jgi:N-acetylglucosamine-6-phosphate deacetylase